MYVTDGKRIRKVTMWQEEYYKWASVRIGLFNKIFTCVYYTVPTATLFAKLKSRGWEQTDIEPPFKRFLKKFFKKQ